MTVLSPSSSWRYHFLFAGRSARCKGSIHPSYRFDPSPCHIRFAGGQAINSSNPLHDWFLLYRFVKSVLLYQMLLSADSSPGYFGENLSASTYFAQLFEQGELNPEDRKFGTVC